ncbi:MAG: SDR family NAD(P)-dependent oxidoreductase [Halioglobus sp.]|nr:SDR family NAD(P)-dependent oxidoreductase [Halioglobus sp.]
MAVVTGGVRRIGAAVARHLHGLGFDIALHYRASAADARALADELAALRPDSCEIFRADLTNPDETLAVAAAIRERYPAIRLLVNNASGFAPTPIDTCTPEQFDALLGSNLRGHIF